MMIILTTLENLPEHCSDCPCCNNEFGYCQADIKKRYSDWRPFWCPLKCDDRTDEERKDEKDSLFRILWGIYGSDIAEKKFEDLQGFPYENTEEYREKEKEYVEKFSEDFNKKVIDDE